MSFDFSPIYWCKAISRLMFRGKWTKLFLRNSSFYSRWDHSNLTKSHTSFPYKNSSGHLSRHHNTTLLSCKVSRIMLINYRPTHSWAALAEVTEKGSHSNADMDTNLSQGNLFLSVFRLSWTWMARRAFEGKKEQVWCFFSFPLFQIISISSAETRRVLFSQEDQFPMDWQLETG